MADASLSQWVESYRRARRESVDARVAVALLMHARQMADDESAWVAVEWYDEVIMAGYVPAVHGPVQRPDWLPGGNARMPGDIRWFERRGPFTKAEILAALRG